MDLLSEEKILTPELIELRKIDPMIGMNNLTPYSM
jgi:hypothetical protein